MNISDAYINSILKEMGVNTKEPPHWLPHIHKVIDMTTKELVDEIPNGYICSYCGKHSYSQVEKCSGCKSTMQRSK